MTGLGSRLGIEQKNKRNLFTDLIVVLFSSLNNCCSDYCLMGSLCNFDLHFFGVEYFSYLLAIHISSLENYVFISFFIHWISFLSGLLLLLCSRCQSSVRCTDIKDLAWFLMSFLDFTSCFLCRLF